MNYGKNSAKRISNTRWLDELSEEEEKVLELAHNLDSKMRNSKPIKVGILDEIGIKK